MKNKYVRLGMFAILVFGLAIGGCSSSPVGIDLTPNESQAVVTVVRGSNVGGSGLQGVLANWVIMVDGVEAGRVGNNGTTRILVDNGRHTIQIVWSYVKSDIIEFTANSNVIFFDTQQVFVNRLPTLTLKSR